MQKLKLARASSDWYDCERDMTPEEMDYGSFSKAADEIEAKNNLKNLKIFVDALLTGV